MKFLVLLTPVPGKTLDDFKPHMMPEIEAVWTSYLGDDLPMVKVGLLDSQIVHLGPFHQIAVLFAKPGE